METLIDHPEIDNSPSNVRAAAPGANPDAAYYPALDGVRALAVLMVFFGHYAGFTPGGAGVNIFFVLSGFLITGLLFDAQDKPHRLRNFYIRRTLRIFPLYYSVWIALLISTPLLHIAWQRINLLWPLYLGNLIPLLTTLHPGMGGPAPVHILRIPPEIQGQLSSLHTLYTGHFWSLCVEEQFYLFWPFVVFAIRKRRNLIALCLAVVVISPLVRIFLVHLLPVTYLMALNGLTPLRLDDFLLGGLGALVLRGPAAGKLRSAGTAILLTGLAVLAIVMVCHAYWQPGAPGLYNNEAWLLKYGFSIYSVSSLGLILICLNPIHPLSRILGIAPLRALGRVSYGFYVFHDLFHTTFFHIATLFRLPRTFAFGLILPFVVTLGLSTLSYMLIERRFLRLKVRFER